MGAADILSHLDAAGLHVSVDGGDLLVKPRDRLTDELRSLIRANKPELLATLSANDAAVPRAWWRLRFPDRGWREVAFAPTVTRSEALLLYQDASDALPILE